MRYFTADNCKSKDGSVIVFFKKKKIQMGIREGIARAVDTLVDYNMQDFMYIAEVAKKMGYTIDTTENRVTFAIGLLVPQTLYAYQVYPHEKAKLISELTEYFLSTFENDNKYVYGTNGAYLDISDFDILSAYKAFEKIYVEAEDKYLKDGKVLPPLTVIYSMMAYILEYDGNKDRIADYQTICDICATQAAKHIDFWKMLESKIDYIWTK